MNNEEARGKGRGAFVENVWFKGVWGSEFSYALLRREWAKKGRA